MAPQVMPRTPTFAVTVTSGAANQTADFGDLTAEAAGGFKPVDVGGVTQSIASYDSLTLGLLGSHTPVVSDGAIHFTGAAGAPNGAVLRCTLTDTTVIDITINVVADTYSASSTAEALNAMSAMGLAGGKTVLLRRGNHATINRADIKNKAYVSTLTLKGEGVWETQIAGLFMEDSSNIRVENLDIFSPSPTAFYGTNTGITLYNCDLHGDPLDPNGDYSLAGSYSNGTGIRSVNDGSSNDIGITLQRCRIRDVYHVASVNLASSSSGFIMEDCKCYNVYADGVKLGIVGAGLAASVPKTLHRNIFYDYIGLSSDADNPHVDMVCQFGGNGNLSVEGVEIIQNAAYQTGNTRCNQGQGITGFDDGIGAEAAVIKNGVVSGNILALGQSNHISLTVDGGTFENNLCVLPSGTWTDPLTNAYINLAHFGGTPIVANNIIETSLPPDPPFSVTGNVVLGKGGSTISYDTQFGVHARPALDWDAVKAAFTSLSGTAGPLGSGYGTYGDARDPSGWSIT